MATEEWTHEEIASSFRKSGEKDSQIKILSELTGKNETTIRAILREQGYKIPEPVMKNAKIAPVQQIPDVVKELVTKELIQITEKTK